MNNKILRKDINRMKSIKSQLEQINKKYPDYFTEYKMPNIKTNNIKYNKELYKLFPTPIKNNNNREILYRIFTYFVHGVEYKLFQKYQEEYANDYTLSANIVIPYYDEHYDMITDIVLLCDPRDCQRIAKTHIQKSPHFRPVTVDSIISTKDNSHWKKQRQCLIDTFNPITSLKHIVPISQDRAKKCSNLLWKLHKENYDININDFFLNETQAQLQLALFGVDNDFQEKYNKKIRNAFATDGYPGFIRNITFKFIQKIYNKEFNGPVSKILREYEKETDTELYGNIIILLFAGHDTTGHTLTWLIFELCKNMEYQKKVQEEVKEFWKYNGDKIIDINDFSRLKFLNLCISEIMRLYPAVADGSHRQLEFDDYIHGKENKLVLVPKGTYIQIPNIFRHRNPILWDRPLKFNPYRKFKDSEIWTGDKFSGINPESERYSPFMYNTRSCLGKYFAQIEMRLILLYIMKDYTFILSPKQQKYDIEFNQGTMGPRDGLLVNIIKNKSGL